MPDVVLLYERSCPNVRAARSNLLRAFAAAKVPAAWRELDLTSKETPPSWRAFGSPSILVDGRDVGGETPGEPAGATCRLYDDGGGLAGAPSVERIVTSLREEPPAPSEPLRPVRFRLGFRRFG